MIIYAGGDMPLYAFSLFLPSIISEVCAMDLVPCISLSDSKFSSLVVLVCDYPLLRLAKAVLINFINLRVHG